MGELQIRGSDDGAWLPYAAAAWAAVFAAFHFVWATGWYVGLNGDPTAAFGKPFFLA